jgi:serine phosphatase RsbU (regulator of sigma subunit)
MNSVVRGIQLGAEDYLPKPFNPTLLEARIKSGLVRKRLHDLEKLHTQSLEREMEIGHRIQSDFLPRKLPKVSGWEIAAHFQAAREVAGDFYDVFRLSDNRLGFFLGDVIDKGVGAALFMSLYRSLLRAFMGNSQGPMASRMANEARVDSAELVANAVMKTNCYVCQTHPEALFTTLFIGVLDPLSGRVEYINAGHNPPKLLRRDGSQCDLPPTGPLVGAIEEVEYVTEMVELSPNEELFIYSDGVVDTQNAVGEFFGKERLQELLAIPIDSATARVELLSISLGKFMRAAKPFDDVTVLVIRRGA